MKNSRPAWTTFSDQNQTSIKLHVPRPPLRRRTHRLMSAALRRAAVLRPHPLDLLGKRDHLGEGGGARGVRDAGLGAASRMQDEQQGLLQEVTHCHTRRAGGGGDPESVMS